jgi:anti-sigma factor RsiW
MLSTDSSSSSACGRAVALRDYAFDELPADERRAMELHLAGCGACVTSLDRLRSLTAALRTVPDREIPQRIAFVSDRVFEPSAFRRFWDSSGRLGFASACVLAVALVVSAWHFSGSYRPVEVHTVVRTASASPSASEIDAAVAKAVAQVRAQIAENDAQVIQTAIQTSEQKRDQEYRDQMVAIAENFMVLQKRLGTSYAALASNDIPGPGAGQ